MLNQRIIEDMKAAMKAGDKERLSAIRMLRAAIKNREIELGHELSEDELFAVMARLVKQRHDAASQYAEGGRPDLEAREKREAAVYASYLPEPLSEKEINQIIEKAVSQTAAAGLKDMGKVMAAIRPKVQGRADMGSLSALVKTRLTKTG